MNTQVRDLLQSLPVLVTAVLEKKVDIDWYVVAKNTNTLRRQCYKHFTETIAPKVAGNGFTVKDETFMLEEMHRAIEANKPLDMRLLDERIKPIIGKRYLKVALLRKFNNLKRTKEIINHLKEMEAYARPPIDRPPRPIPVGLDQAADHIISDLHSVDAPDAHISMLSEYHSAPADANAYTSSEGQQIINIDDIKTSAFLSAVYTDAFAEQD